MANLRSFKFFDFESTEKVSNILLNPANGEAITIEVSGADGVSLVVQGRTDLEESNWFTIGVVSLLDYDIKPKITTSGLYMAPIAGVAKIRMVSENPVGDFKVFAVGKRVFSADCGGCNRCVQTVVQ